MPRAKSSKTRRARVGSTTTTPAKKCKVKKFKSLAQAKGFTAGYNAGKPSKPAKRKGNTVTIC